MTQSQRYSGAVTLQMIVKWIMLLQFCCLTMSFFWATTRWRQMNVWLYVNVTLPQQWVHNWNNLLISWKRSAYRSSKGATWAQSAFEVDSHSIFPKFMSAISAYRGDAASQIMTFSITNTHHQTAQLFFVRTLAQTHHHPFPLPPHVFSFSPSWMTLTDRLVATGTTPYLLCRSVAGKCEIHNKMAQIGLKMESISNLQQTAIT